MQLLLLSISFTFSRAQAAFMFQLRDIDSMALAKLDNAGVDSLDVAIHARA